MALQSLLWTARTVEDFNWEDADAFYEWITDWTTSNVIPPNIWIGVTAENQEWAEKRIPHLLKIPARVRFLSCEPLSGPINFRGMDFLMSEFNSSPHGWHNWLRQRLHWIIAGGESGPYAQPSHRDWFRSLRDQCASANVPFFFKQWGEWLPSDHAEYAITCAQECAQKTPKTMRGHKLEDSTLMLRAGTHISGNHLDGRYHEAFPTT